MYRSVAIWLLGQSLRNPGATTAVAILLGTPRGRLLLRILGSELARTNYRIGSRVGVELIYPAVAPHVLLGGIAVAATVAILGGGQITSRLGGSGTEGGVAPSQWGTDEMYGHSRDPRFEVVKFAIEQSPAIPLIFR